MSELCQIICALRQPSSASFKLTEKESFVENSTMLGNMLEKGGSVLGPKEPEGWDLLSTAEFIICDVVAMPKTHIYNPAVISQKRCFKLLDRGSGHISLYSTSIKQP